MDKEFSKLCTPAKVYFIISIVSCVVALFNGLNYMTVLFNVIIAFVWTAVLGWICQNGYSNVSWFLVALPYIIMILMFFRIISGMSSNSTIMMAIPPSANQQMMM